MLTTKEKGNQLAEKLIEKLPYLLDLMEKGSEKGSDSVDLYCHVVKFRISRIA